MLHRPKYLFRTIACTGIVLVTGVMPALALNPAGDWKVADGVAIIRVAPCDGSMWGAVVWEQTPGGHDIHNPDVTKQKRPSLGMPILLDMKKKPDEDQWEGQVYNAKDGQIYSSTIKPLDPEHMAIQGCVLGFLCGGETWTRIQGPLPSNPANSMAKGSKTTGNAPAKPVAATKPAPPPMAANQKPAAPANPADPVGDICLLPDIAARLAH